MATITSLDFNVSSSWDGSGVRAARNDLDELQADLQRIAETRATAQVGINIDRSNLEEVRTELEQIGDMRVTATVGVKIDSTGLNEFRAELDQVGRTRAQATVGANVDDTNLRAFQDRINQVGSTRVTANASVDVDSTRLNALIANLRAFDGERAVAHAEVEVNSAGLTEINLTLDRFGARRVTAHADVDVDSADTSLRRLGGSADDTVRRLGTIAPAGNGASSSLVGMGSAASNSTVAIAGFLAVLILIGPAAALATAALIGVLGGGFIAMGALALSGVAKVKSAMSGLASTFKEEATKAASAMQGPLIAGINELTAGLKRLEPAFQAAFKATGPLIKPLVDALLDFMNHVMPGVIAALKAAGPVFDGLKTGLSALGDGISTMFKGMAAGAQGAGAALSVFLKGVGTLLGIVGKAFGEMSAAGAKSLAGIMTGLNAFVGAAMGGFVTAVRTMNGVLGPFMAAFGQAFGALLKAAIQMFAAVATVIMTALTPALKQLPAVFAQIIPSLTKVAISLMPAFVSIGKLLATVLIAVTPLINLMAKGFTLLAPVLNIVAKGIALVTDGISTGIKWITDWTARINDLKTVWNTVWNAMKVATDAVWAAMKTGWQATVSFFTSAWTTVGNALSAAWSAVWNAMKTAASAIWTAMTTAWNAVVTGMTTIWNTLGNALSAAWSSVWNAMKTAASAIWTAMTAAWSAVVTGFTTVWNTLGNALSASWSALWNAMKTAATAVWSALQTAWSAFMNAIQAALSAIGTAIKASWQAMWSAMETAANAVWNALKTAWTATMNAIGSALSTIGTAIKTAWSAMWNAIKTAGEAVWTALQAAWKNTLSALQTAATATLNALKTAWSAAWNAIKSAGESIWTALQSAWKSTTSALSTAMNAFGSAAKTAWSATWNAIKSTAQTIWGGIKAVVGGGVNGVIDIINGIIGAWDTIVNAVGLKKLNIGKITYHASFADGGPVHGPGTSTSDSIPARLSNGEHVWTANEVSAAGGHGAVAGMRSRVLGGLPVRSMGKLGFASGGGAGDSGGSDSGLGSTTDPDTPDHATPQQKAAANVPGVYLKGGDQKIGKDNYKHLTAIQKSIVDAAGVDHVDKSILGQIGDKIGGIAKGGLHGLEDIEKLGASALGFIGKELLDHIFEPLIKPLTGDMGAGVVGEFAVDESKKIVDEMVDMIVHKDEDAGGGAVGGKIPQGEHLAIIDAALKAAGVPPPGSIGQWEAGLNTLITRESGWNAGVVNKWDSNAAKGTPSGGLAQVIGPTFAAYHVAGTPNNLLNPVANVAAAINYIVHRYGGIGNVQQANASKPPKGYARGTNSADAGTALVGENGPELINFGGGEQVIPNGQTQDILGGGQLSPDWAKAWNQAAVVMQNSTGNMQNQALTFLTTMRKNFNDQGSTLSTDWRKNWDQNKVQAAASWDSTAVSAATFSDKLTKQFGESGTTLQQTWQKSLDGTSQESTKYWTDTEGVFTNGGTAVAKSYTDTGTVMEADWQKSLDTANQNTTKYWTDTEGSFSNGSTWMTGSFFPPVNDFLTKTFPQSFATGAAAVATGWDGLKQEVYTPVKAIVDTVYNGGIRGVWNVIAGAFGAKTLDEFAMPAFATGGAVTGPGTGTSDSITARLSHGEHVWTASEVQGAGGHQAVAGMRSRAKGGNARTMGANGRYATGGGVDATAGGTGAQGGLGTPTDGAAVDVQSLASLTLGNIAGKANPMLDTIAKQGKDAVDAMIPGTPDLENAMNGMIDGMVSSAESWITTNDISFVMGGVNDAAAQAWADSQVGKPYALGGDFVNGIDCSEYQSGIARAILGQTPAPWFTTFAFEGATAPEGFEENLQAPYMVGITNVGVGHMAGTLNGKNYEATPPAVRSGPSARGYDDGMFTNRYGFKPSIETSSGAVTDSNHLAIIDAAMAAAGVPPPDTQAAWEAGMNTIINRESAWDPNAINLTDSNAQAGMPSQGLAQVIPPTFAAYHVAGTSSNILDPIANVAAAINYIVHTYGSIGNVQQANPNLPPLGYRNGTKSAMSGWHIVGEEGPEPVNFGGGGQGVRSFKDMLGDFREHGGRRDGGSGDHHEDHSVTIHEGGVPVTITIQGNCDKDTAKVLTSKDFADQVTNAIIAGVGRKSS